MPTQTPKATTKVAKVAKSTTKPTKAGLTDALATLTEKPADVLEVRYIPLRLAMLLDGNPKRHDIGSIAESIQRNGFRDPPIWDATLNSGKGGIVAGNGRTETLMWMFDQGQSVPRGIAVDGAGEWLMPVVFGCDAASEAQANAFAIDHNSLTLTGGDFTALDISRIYDNELYVKYLQKQQQKGIMPVTVDQDDLALLIRLGQQEDSLEFDDGTGAGPGTGTTGSADTERGSERGSGRQEGDDDGTGPGIAEGAGTGEDAPPNSSVRMLQLFLDTETHPEMMMMIANLHEVYETTNPTDCILAVMRDAYTHTHHFKPDDSEDN